MKVCENCGCEHNGSYASGRFCSIKCSRGFSTKAKRKEINEKVSKARKGSGHKNVAKICPTCKSSFEIRWNKRNQIYCSTICVRRSDEVKKKISEKVKGKNAGSKNGMYGKSPKNTKNIEVFSKKHTGNKIFTVRSSYEKIIVDKINENKLISKFTYEPKKYKVEYKDENGVERTYQPDFLIEDNQVREIKNNWSAGLEETKLKEIAFRQKFPNIDYRIIAW